MTRDEILAMEPGRELDVLVAEKVMGWTDLDCTEVKWIEFMGRKTANHMLGPIDKYSSDISAAWEVLEKMQESNDCVTLSWGSGSWGCHILIGKVMHMSADDEEWYYKESMYDSPSAPEAICKAALLAVMDQTNDTAYDEGGE